MADVLADANPGQIDTSDPDEAAGWIRRLYAPNLIRMRGPGRERFHFRHITVGLDGLAVSVFEHSVATEMPWQAPMYDHVVLARPVQGRLMVADAATDQMLVPEDGQWFLMDPDITSRTAWSENLRLEIVNFDRSQLNRTAADLLGVEQESSLRLPLSTGLSPARCRPWEWYVKFLVHGVAENDSGTELVRHEAFRMAVAALLEAFPHRWSEPHRIPGTSGSAVVRRAVAFIESCPHRPLNSADIAAAAHASVRDLQRAFRRCLGTTPMAYLRRVRLEQAHRELVAAEPGMTTVADVARRWGFPRPGRFAEAYRAMYERAPEAVLAGVADDR